MKKQHAFIFIALIFLCYGAISQTPGTIDESFGGTGIVFTDFDNDFNSITKVLIQDDEKIIVCGFTGYTFSSQSCNLARYYSNGDIDKTFGQGGSVSFSLGGDVSQALDMALAPDGKILVTGYATDGPTNDFSTACFTSSGVLDASFGNNGIKKTDLGHNEIANSILVQDDGKIVILGQITYVGGETNMAICRYLANGNTDVGFGTNGHIVYDLNNGSIDMPKGLVMHLGKILACSFAFNGNSSDYDALVLARFNMDGSPDVSFAVAGFSLLDGLTIDGMFLYPETDVAVAPDDKIVVSAHVNSLDGLDFAIFRFQSNGYPDLSFDGDGMVVTNMIGANSPASVLVQPDGEILAGGYHFNTDDNDFCLARYLVNGELDADFGNYFGVSWLNMSLAEDYYDRITSIALQQDGKIIAAGNAVNASGDTDFAIARYYSGLAIHIEANDQESQYLHVFPNPVINKEMHCTFLLTQNETVKISLFSTDGRKIADLMNEMHLPGYHEQTFSLPGNIRAGSYILRFSTSQGAEFLKVIVAD